MLLALGRSQPAQEPAAHDRRLGAAREPRPELWMFGIEPELGPRHGARYVERPSDEGVNELFNQATVFVQTSHHEGFCLPPLEAMAAGAPWSRTDAHGNRDFCRDGANCLIAEADPESVSGALARLFGDPALRARLAERAGDRARLRLGAAYRPARVVLPGFRAPRRYAAPRARRPRAREPAFLGRSRPAQAAVPRCRRPPRRLARWGR